MDEAHRQLLDQRYYRKLDEDPTQAHAEKVKALIQEMLDLKEGHC